MTISIQLAGELVSPEIVACFMDFRAGPQYIKIYYTCGHVLRYMTYCEVNCHETWP